MADNHSKINKHIATVIFYFFKVCGLATVKLIDIRMKGNKISCWITEKSELGSFYNIILILILILTGVPGTKFAIESNYFGMYQKEVTVVTIVDVYFELCSIIVLMTFCVQQEKISFIANKISDAVELSVIIDTKKFCESDPVTFATKKVLLFPVISSFIVIIGIIFTTALHQNISIICFGICHLLSFLINSCVFLQYSLILDFIRNLFKLINDTFKKLSNPPINGPCKIWDHEIKQPIKIDKLMQLYILLCEISEELSDIYSFTMMWCIINDFLYLFISLYAKIRRLIIPGEPLFSAGTFYDFINIYFNLFPLPLLVISASNTVKEVIY